MKQDYLGECNEFKISLEDFTSQFCSRCVQLECLRSQHGKSKFEQRILTWEDRLFLHVPRMDPSNPLFTEIKSKDFIQLGGNKSRYIPSGWVDPLAPEPSEPSEPSVAEPVMTEPVRDVQDRRGVMLANVEKPKTTSSSKDTWEPPKKPDGVVIKAGAKIRLG